MPALLICTAGAPERIGGVSRWSLGFARDCAGGPAIEFGLVLPFLVLLLVGMIEFGMTLNNFNMLTEAVRTGARQLSISRGSSTAYTDIVNQVHGSAASLIAANLSITLTVNGTQCGNDTTCGTALSNAQGEPAVIQGSYPCDLAFLSYNFWPNCTLVAQTTERVE
jgi:Flp pilus assembly protein TadG